MARSFKKNLHFQGSLGSIYKFAEVYDLEGRNLRAGRNPNKPHKVYSSWEHSKYLFFLRLQIIY